MKYFTRTEQCEQGTRNGGDEIEFLLNKMKIERSRERQPSGSFLGVIHGISMLTISQQFNANGTKFRSVKKLQIQELTKI